jgi:probable rRNA maturation factor
MAVLIDNNQNKISISLKKVKKTAQAVLDALDFPDGELSILIVDDHQIEKYNRNYLNRRGPTNVIAFPMRDGAFSDINPELLGDVVISVETAQKEGTSVGITMEERFVQLLIHGILHLFGFDHEKNQQEALHMEKKSKELLSLIKHQ